MNIERTLTILEFCYHHRNWTEFTVTKLSKHFETIPASYLKSWLDAGLIYQSSYGRFALTTRFKKLLEQHFIELSKPSPTEPNIDMTSHEI